MARRTFLPLLFTLAGLAVCAAPGAGLASVVTDPIGAVINGDVGQLDGPTFAARFHTLEIGTTAMEPNLRVGNLVLTDRTAYASEPIARGDLIEFQPTRAAAITCGVTANNKLSFVKRVIGLPGDHVELRAGSRDALVNGVSFVVANQQPNPLQGATASLPASAFDVPPGTLFVLGDNRSNSCDSHQWSDPFLPVGNIRGRISAIYFPRGRVARIFTTGTIQPVDVSISPQRPRFDYLLILGRGAEQILGATQGILDCARKRDCEQLRLDRAFGEETKLQLLGRLRGELAGAIKTQLRTLRTPASRLVGDCAAPTARWLAATLGRDRRVARSRPPALVNSRTIAIQTEHHVLRAITRTVACWS